MKTLPSNLWTSAVLRQRMAQEAAFEDPHKPHYWFVVPQGDTKTDTIILKNFDPSFLHIEPHEMQQEYAKDLRRRLQRQAHFDGIWMVGWTHPPSSGQAVSLDGDNCWNRLVMMWLDEDGDPQFPFDTFRDFVSILQEDPDYYVDLAAKAHAQWKEEYGKKAVKDDFGIKDSQISKDVLKSLH